MTPHRVLLRLAAVAVTVAIALWILKSAFDSAVQIQWSLMDPWLIAAALFVACLQECAGTAGAQAALAAFRQRASFHRLLIVTTVATATSSMVPVPAGIPARIWLQKTWLAIPVPRSTAAIALETLCGYGILALFALAGVFLFDTNALSTEWHYLPALTAIATLGLLIVWLLRARLRSLLGQLVIMRPMLLPAMATLVLNIIIIGLATSRLWLILHALAVNAASVPEITAALCIARIAGVASMIPMGLGSRDVTLTGLLVLSGVPLPIAALAAAVDRVLSTAPYLVVALIGWPLLRRAGALDKHGDAIQ